MRRPGPFRLFFARQIELEVLGRFTGFVDLGSGARPVLSGLLSGVCLLLDSVLSGDLAHAVEFELLPFLQLSPYRPDLASVVP